MIQKQKIKDFLKELSSDSPTPGGGAVAAITASMGASLAIMALKISSNRKTFKELSEIDQEKVRTNLNELELLKNSMDKLIDEDAEVFNGYMKAMKKHDEDALRKATKACFDVPYHLALLCSEAIERIRLTDKYVVSSVDSDLKMSYILLKASLSSCGINMKINLTSYIDEDSKIKYKSIVPMIEETVK